MKRFSSLVLFASLFVLAACADSDDPAGVPDPVAGLNMTAVEAAALAEVFAGEAFGSIMGQVPEGGGAAAAPVPFDVQVSVTAPCPLGGEVAFQGAVEGELDLEAESISVSFTASQIHASCAVDVEGVTVTVSGNPGLNLSSQLNVAGNPPQGTHSATLTGGFTWSAADGREGTCDIDVSTTMDVGTETGSASGTICGHALEVTVG